MERMTLVSYSSVASRHYSSDFAPPPTYTRSDALYSAEPLGIYPDHHSPPFADSSKVFQQRVQEFAAVCACRRFCGARNDSKTMRLESRSDVCGVLDEDVHLSRPSAKMIRAQAAKRHETDPVNALGLLEVLALAPMPLPETCQDPNRSVE